MLRPSGVLGPLALCLCVAAASTLTIVDPDALVAEDTLVSPLALVQEGYAQQAKAAGPQTRGTIVSHDPAKVEAMALAAVKRAKKAAIALQTARQVVVRLQELGDTTGTAAALKTEQYAKRLFLEARSKSEPLVAEARANYEATQGTEIQQVAREVAQDTWRSMTGRPLKPGSHPTPGDELQYGSLRAGARRKEIRRIKRNLAHDYAEQAHESQVAAIGAQKKIDAMPKGSITHVTAIARIANEAKVSLHGVNAAKAKVEATHARMLKREADEKLAKLAAKKKTKSKRKASKTAKEVIAQAENDVAAAMSTVSEAATSRGMVDNSWKNQIGDMMKNGQPAAANEAADRVVSQRIRKAVASQVKKDPLEDMTNDVKDAGNIIAAAAKNHEASSGATSAAKRL